MCSSDLGYDEPPWAVATHGDRHHVQGFGSLAEEMGWPVMFVNPTRFNSPYYKEMMEGLEAAGQPPIVIARGNSIAGWEVLHPPSGERLPKADDNMTVLAREVHGVRVLLLSDLGEAGQAGLGRERFGFAQRQCGDRHARRGRAAWPSAARGDRAEGNRAQRLHVSARGDPVGGAAGAFGQTQRDVVQHAG